MLAATVPLKTLAGQRVITFDSTQCTVSGMQSGVHSASPGSPVRSGFLASSWGQSVGNLGLLRPKLGRSLIRRRADRFFSGCTLLDKKTRLPASLFAVVNQYPSSDDAHWVCAWLNSQSPANMNFPYNAQQVLAYYSAADSNALAFFKKYTETNT